MLTLARAGRRKLLNNHCAERNPGLAWASCVAHKPASIPLPTSPHVGIATRGLTVPFDSCIAKSRGIKRGRVIHDGAEHTPSAATNEGLLGDIRLIADRPSKL